MDKAVEECAAGVLRSLGEGGPASAGSAEDAKGTTAVKPWGSTRVAYRPCTGRSAVWKEEFSRWMDAVCQNEQVLDAVLA